MIEKISTSLQRLGLTKYQASSLAVLAIRSDQTAESVSKKGSIPYTKVYAVLDSLRDMGFVLSTLERPKRYTSIELACIIKRLVEKQENQAKFIEMWGQEAKKIFENIKKEETSLVVSQN